MNAPRRFQQLRRTLARFLALAVAVTFLHVFAMMGFEGLSFRQAVWLTATTVSTVGYGDLYAKTALGQISTIVLLCAVGIFLAAQAASAWFDYRLARRDAMARGEWDWSKALKDHVVIVAPGRVGELFLVRLVTELEHHQTTRGSNVVVVSDAFREGCPAPCSPAT